MNKQKLLDLMNDVEKTIYIANNASGYCTCGLRMSGHPKLNSHVATDNGDLAAERVRERVLEVILELTK